MLAVWITSEYHNEHCTSSYQDIGENEVDQEQTGGEQSTKVSRKVALN